MSLYFNTINTGSRCPCIREVTFSNDMVKKIGNIKMYDSKEISELIGLTEQSVRMYFRTGKLKGKKIGKNWFISNKDLKEYLLSHEN